MTDWRIEPTDAYERAHKYYEKKQPQELKAVLDNLDRYFKAVAQGVHPQFVFAGYIHDEGKGVRALDQRGGAGKVSLDF